jgi:hypothetical protein
LAFQRTNSAASAKIPRRSCSTVRNSNGQIATLAEPELPQFIEHGRITGGHSTADAGILWPGAKNPDAHYSIRLLRVQRERPCSRAAK